MNVALDSLLVNGLRKLGIGFTDDIIKKFYAYLRELQEWNKKTNLTAIIKEDEIITKHFFDSLSCMYVLPDLYNKKAIDIGTGAGFPGIPLKICFSDMELTLLDSSIKKIQFLEHIINVLGLKNVNVLYGRAEDLAKTKHREKYDVVFARALAGLPVLIEICLPFTKTGGLFISQKSNKVEEEIKEAGRVLELIGGRIVKIEEVNIPFLESKRSLVVIEKLKSTSLNYPRKSGIPQKRPILS